MHRDILTDKQKELLPLVHKFSKNFGLVGGTAVALHIGHRESIDFDLFSNEAFDTMKIRRKLISSGYHPRVVRDEMGQYTLFIADVQMTFFHYPYPLKFSEDFDGIVYIPDLLTLGAMKIFALGRRAKWKDYVDLAFIVKEHYSLNDIIKKAKEIFLEECNERIVREQLSYFEDINYAEEVVYRPGYEMTEDEVKKILLETSLTQ